MTNKLSILVLCGGQSTEHEISVISARNVVAGLDKNKYEVAIAYILSDGRWLFIQSPEDFLLNDVKALAAKPAAVYIHFAPGNPHPFIITTAPQQPVIFDCVFPMLHGTNGEDGTMQGFLEILNIPYVGADVLSSAIIMDKDATKRLLKEAGLPVVKFLYFSKSESNKINYDDVKKQLGEILFIKPNSLGSAAGVSKVTNLSEFNAALKTAFEYDEHILIEEAMVARELECSVLGNENPKASKPGEVVKHTDFYTYEAKYLDEKAATIKSPAENISAALISTIQDLAIQAFKITRCVGMARVDFFYTQDEKLYINELNTIPGFTNISLYPKNWIATGMSYAELLDELINFGLARFKEKKKLNRIYKSCAD